MQYVMSAFSANMLPPTVEGDLEPSPRAALVAVEFQRLSLEAARTFAPGCRSVVGHEGTAALFSQLLRTPVPCDRATVRLNRGTQHLLGQYVGPRLPEGATALPEGAEVQWYLVWVS
jgi:hypothetical protein